VSQAGVWGRMVSCKPIRKLFAIRHWWNVPAKTLPASSAHCGAATLAAASGLVPTPGVWIFSRSTNERFNQTANRVHFF